MKANYINECIDLEGHIVERPIVKRIRITLFASIKFLFDRLLSVFGLIVASPIMLIIAIAIKLDSPGPVFFKQKRTGKGGKIITIYKFRTMVVDNDVHDFSKADQHTKVGKFLRKTSLDELGQIFNTFTGDLSFIGPRPWIPDYYENMNEEQRHRCDVRPGITGLAQVKGRNNISIFEKINYDLEYIRNYSLIQDIKIIFWTIKSVISGSGADAGKGTIENELNDLKTQEIKLNDIAKLNKEK